MSFDKITAEFRYINTYEKYYMTFQYHTFNFKESRKHNTIRTLYNMDINILSW